MLKISVGLLILVSSFSCYAMDPPKIITFKNNVVYDHDAHKGDCISCHDTPAGGNKIPDFGKEVAHKLCVGCHSAMGNGPTSCNGCHKK